MDRLTRNWLWLLGLTLATTLAALVPAASAGLLLLAFLKARAILGGFLHLRAAPGWLMAVSVPLALWLILLAGLYAL